MRQLTLRVDERLLVRLKDVAARRGQSVNAYAGAVLGAAVDPDLANSELERLRERLARAGLLADAPASKVAVPSARELARAKAAAGRGRALSDLVSEGRR